MAAQSRLPWARHRAGVPQYLRSRLQVCLPRCENVLMRSPPGPLRFGLIVAIVAGIGMTACDDAADAEPDPIVIGVGSTREQRVLAALTVAALEDAGFDPVLATDLGGTVGLRRAALREEIDVFWDYTGAAWGLGLGQQNPPAEPAESFERVREEDAERGLVWLPPSDANATLALFVRDDDLPEPPAANGLEWLSGRLSSGQAPVCVDPDFEVRAGGLAELASIYPMDLRRVDVVPAEEGRAIAMTADGSCFAGLATATSGAAVSEGLVPVSDELGAFPAFVVAPITTEVAIDDEPGLPEALGTVTERLDTKGLAALNAEAESAPDAGELQSIAERFLNLETGGGS